MYSHPHLQTMHNHIFPMEKLAEKLVYSPAMVGILLIITGVLSGIVAGMGMGGMDKDLILAKTCDLLQMLANLRLGSLTDITKVCAEQDHLIIAGSKGQRIDLQFIQYAGGIAGVVISYNIDSQRRGDIDPAEAGLQCVHTYVPRLSA